MTGAPAPAATIKVEIAFLSAGSAFSQVAQWTDVSADLRSVSITRGRQVELDRFNAGTATVVLANRSAQYDPLNTSGPHFGNILPMKRIRISVSTDGILPEIFEGYVQGYAQAYQYTKDATTTLTCSDAFLVLAGTSLPTGFYSNVVAGDGAKFYYRLDEAAGSTFATDSISGQRLTKNGAGTFGATSLLPYESDGAYSQPSGTPSQANFLFNGSSSVAIKSTGGIQGMTLDWRRGGTIQNVTAPSTTAWSALTAIDVRARFSIPDLSVTAASFPLVTKGCVVNVGVGGHSGENPFALIIQNRGDFPEPIKVVAQMGRPVTGGPTLVIASDGYSIPGLVAGSIQWVGMTAVAAGTNWTVNIYSHNDVSAPADITTWTLLAGGLVYPLTTATLPYSADNPVAIGQYVNSAHSTAMTTYPLCTVYQAAVRSSVNGTVLVNPDFTDTGQWAPGDSNGTTGTDPSGAVWTANGLALEVGAATPFSIEAIIEWDTTQTVGSANWIIAGQGDGRNGWYLQVTAANHLNLQVIQGGATTAFASDISVSVTDGLPHHVVGTYDASGTPAVYVDGVNVTDGTSRVVASVTLTGNGFGIGLASQLAGFGEFSWSGTIDDVSVYPTALSSTQVATHYSYAFTPAAGDTTGGRINRILTAIGWDSTKQAIDGGTVLLQPTALATDALTYLQSAALSDQGLGILFVSRDGNIVFHDAGHDFDNDTPALTLDQTNFMTVEVEYNDQNIRNQVSVSRVGGTVQTATDQASVNAYLPHAYALTDLMVADDGVALQTAGIILSAYAQPATRITSVTVNRAGAALGNAGQYDKLLTVDIGDTIAVKYTPLGGVALSSLYTIEGVEHVITPDAGAWIITYRLAPSLSTLIAAPITWVYLNSRYATWTAIPPRVWNGLSL